MATEGSSESLVVVGVDGSPESVAALRWAAGYATATGARIRAVLSWHYPGAFGLSPYGRAPESVTDEVREEMSEALGKAIAAGAPGVDVEQALDYGHPAEVLVNESREADLLVVGQRGHGSFSGMVLGSVSLHLVTHAHCPVVVVRADK